jgi:hypothetical protein
VNLSILRHHGGCVIVIRGYRGTFFWGGSRWRYDSLDRGTILYLPCPEGGWEGMKSWVVIRLQKFPISFRINKRVLFVIFLLTLGNIAAAVFNIGVGEYPIPPWEVLKTVVGMGNGDYDFVVNTLRVPRTLVAFLVGVGLSDDLDDGKCIWSELGALLALASLDCHFITDNATTIPSLRRSSIGG